MKTYVINLPKDTERKTYMTKILQEQNIKDIVFVDAIYGKKLSLQEKELLFDSKKFTAKYAKLPNDAQIGCTLSHRKCYEELLNSGENCCLIFEDDIVPNFSVLPVIKKIENFVKTSDEPVIVLLSGWFWYTKKISIDSILLGQLYSGFLAHSYMLNEKAAKLLLENKAYYVADDWYEFRKNLGIKTYGIIPHVVNQNWNGDFKSFTESLSIKYEKGFLVTKCGLKVKGFIQKLLASCGHFEGAV